MLNYNQDTNMISMIAKDTGDFVISLEDYLLAEGDVVYFTVNKELEKENPLIAKAITTFDNYRAVVRLSSADTDIPVGTYWYDVQVNTADGRVDTVLGPAKFKIMGGVKF